MSRLQVEISVSVKAEVLKLLKKNDVTLEDFVKMKNIEPPVAVEVLTDQGACKVTGSLESVEAVRKALKAEMHRINTVTLQSHSAISTCEADKAENSDLKTNESKSKLESYGNSDLTDIPASSSSVNASEKRPKRVRKLKSSEPEPKTPNLPLANTASASDSKSALQSEEKEEEKPLEKDGIGQAASTPDAHTNEGIIRRVKDGQLVEVVVEKERHNYMMMQYNGEINKDFKNIYIYEEDGEHKVALELKVNTQNAKADAIKRYNAYLGRFCCETCQLPNSVENSVMESIAAVPGIENVSVVVCEDNKSFKLFGSKKNVELMKSHIKEQFDYAEHQEEEWHCAPGKKKPAKKACYHFVIKSGKALPLSASLPKSNKKSSLEVKFSEWRNDISVDILVVAVDSKMNYDKDIRAIQPPTDLKNFLNSKDLSLLKLVAEEAPKSLKKVKKILHIVLLETFDTNAATDVATFERSLKDAIIECINYADREKLTSLAIPHLCPGFCDVDAFIHHAMEALKFRDGKSAKKPGSLNSVIFVAKNGSLKQEMAEKFASLIDDPDD